METLRHIFGPVVDSLVSGADPGAVTTASSLLGTLFSVFNSGVLVVGTLIVSYVAVVGVINTANDGESMGRNWSSLWTPVRIVAGGASLLPTASGFSFIQLFAMMLALWGAGLANTIYVKGVEFGVLDPSGIVGAAKAPGSYTGLREFARQYTAASYCARAANLLYADPNTGYSPQVQANSTADAIINQGGRHEYVFELKDRNRSTNLAGGAPICGTVKVAEYHAQAVDDPTAQATEQVRQQVSEVKKRAVVHMMNDLDQWVNTWPRSVSESTWDTVNSARFNEIVGQYEGQIVSDLSGLTSGANAAVNVGLNAFLNSLTMEGWANAGGWFQRVGQVRFQLSTIFSEPPGTVGEPVLTGLPGDAASREFMSSVALARDITRKSETHNDYTAAEVQPEDVASAIPSDPQGAINVGQMKTDMDAKMSSWANNAMHNMVNIAIAGDGSDGTSSFCGSAGEIGGSLNRMKCLGDYLTVTLNAARAMDAALKTSVAVLRVGAGVLSSVKGVGTGLDLDKIVNPIWDWVMAVPVPYLAKIVSYLEGLAFYFGVFLPALPYGLFMIVFVAWVLAVLQTMLAAPLWAVMHMTPDRTFIGSQRQGYLLLMALFARPALAVVGLFAGVLVSDPVIDFVAQGFFAMRGAVVTSTGTVGAIAEFGSFSWWLIVFGFTLLPVLYMCFGLPQVLADKVLQWVGGGIADLGETSALNEMRGGMSQARALGSVPAGGGMGRLPGRGKGGGYIPPANGGDRPGGGPNGGPSGGPPISSGGQGVAPRLPPPPNPPRSSGQGQAGIGPAGPAAPGKGSGRRDPVVITQNPQGAGPKRS
ncbi:DotA/TraY family protein [Burkholderia vietnamiensis]|uniref:DotA/TraY family protein n=1 Tax=Burkholderia vietnamiensis TaxID=60552 RepID=UPI001ABBC0D3|nr:DotA/TraY family protein [Burkholderia vietnamiensis]